MAQSHLVGRFQKDMVSSLVDKYVLGSGMADLDCYLCIQVDRFHLDKVLVEVQCLVDMYHLDMVSGWEDKSGMV